MNNHESHYNVGKVTGVCEVCGKTFHRDGDLVAISNYSSQPSFIAPDPDKAKRYADWIVSTFTFCDEHLPPMPELVKEDIQEERNRRSADLNAVSATYHYRDLTRNLMDAMARQRRKYINRGGA